MGSVWFNPFEPAWTTVWLREPGVQGSLTWGSVRKSWTTLNSLEIILWTLLPLELSGLRRFTRCWTPRTLVKHHHRPGSLCCTMIWTGVEPHQTLIKLHCRPGSLCCTMVRTGSEELNHPELISNSTAELALLSMVQTGLEELNHRKLMRNYPMNLAPSGAQWFEEFGVVQLLRTYSNHSTTQGTKP